MIGLGTIVNCITVFAGTSVGLLLKGGLPQRFEKIIMQALGLCTFFIGASGALTGLLTITDSGTLDTQNIMLLVLCMAFGAMIGEAIDIEKRLEHIGAWFQRRFAANDQSDFVEAFVSASLLFCVGAMAIVGSLEDGLTGDHSILFAKAILDGVAAIVFAASLGRGVYLSLLPLLVYQGGLTLLAGVIRPYLSDTLISQMSCVGSVLIFAIGFNLCFDKKIKIGNLLPAMFLPIFFALLKSFFPALPF